jgi:hypothetical protein
MFPFAGLLLGLTSRKWRRGAKSLVLAALLLVGSAFGLAGCASRENIQNFGTPAGTYTLTVLARSGNTQHSTTVTLVVNP